MPVYGGVTDAGREDYGHSLVTWETMLYGIRAGLDSRRPGFAPAWIRAGLDSRWPGFALAWDSMILAGALRGPVRQRSRSTGDQGPPPLTYLYDLPPGRSPLTWTRIVPTSE